MSDFDVYDDIPDDVLDGDETVFEMEDPNDIIEKAQHNIEPSDYNQATLLSYASQSVDIWVKVFSILEPEYFEPEYRKVVRFLKKYYRDNGKLPPLRIVRLETGVTLEIIDPEEVSREDVCTDVMERFDHFCRERATYNLLNKISSEWNPRKSGNRETLAMYQKEFEKVTAISIKRDLGMEIHRDIEEYLEIEKKFGAISTGIPYLDKAFDGGVGQPSLNIFSGSSGHGKSILLQNIAFNYALSGKNVAFYTLELELPIIAKRFAAMMTDTDIGLVSEHIRAVATQLRMEGGAQGEIWVKKFPMGTNMAEIESHFRDLCLETDKEFDVVCIDYIDVMAPNNKSINLGDIHTKDKNIIEDMNNFFHKNNIIGWTASQQTKTAVEERELKTSNVGGGRSKVDTADNVIMLRRNEEEMDKEILWAIIRKARSSGGLNSKIPLRWNKKTQRVGDGDWETFVKENPNIFGKKSMEMRAEDEKVSETVKKDAIAQEQGVVGKDKQTTSKKADAGKMQASVLKSKLKKGILKDERRETGETDA